MRSYLGYYLDPSGMERPCRQDAAAETHAGGDEHPGSMEELLSLYHVLENKSFSSYSSGPLETPCCSDTPATPACKCYTDPGLLEIIPRMQVLPAEEVSCDLHSEEFEDVADKEDFP
jgi:hypothetical protein